MMRDIPFLLVIDDLEVEQDWWDGQNMMELLSHFGGETHVLISTQLPNAINVQPPRLLHLSAGEAMSLMRGTLGDLPTEDVDALRALEKKLELLQLAKEKLEAMEDSFLYEGNNSSNKLDVQIALNIYYEFAHLRTTLLESRAKLMIRGGLYDILEQLYRQALNI
ncbi:hypothetical protein J5N97_019812 [Dioscorea zingiberensis]|uniref:Uncharacterized protein n=1 Tax=Dioscorea zingiberensis TaxID=325984 RepID=A0A9D5HD78_9LILI|nr:hypothetical protein J5N97_019812 [Dioscorea zingiberensis]